ncbi:MAG: ABC transporter permease, partial [SAR202 cluster bacterium]|nr:ABC transporter permease [SAR202 cluster bacterium]
MAEEAVIPSTASDSLEQQDEEFSVASQWRLMWWRFRRHKLALIAGVILALFYASFPLSEFIG